MDTHKHKDDQRVIDLLYQLGNTYLEKGDYDNAIDKFKKLIQLGELNAKTFLTLSKAYILKEQFDQESLKIFEAALKFEPENPVLNVILSQIYLNTNRDDEFACQVYQNALQHNPGNINELLSRLVNIYVQKEDLESARDLMQQAIQFEKSLPVILPPYVEQEWKNYSFDAVSKLFQQIIEHTNDLQFYPWLIINSILRSTHDQEYFKISEKELKYFTKYFSKFETIQRLFDLYLFLFTENFLVQNKSTQKKEKQSDSIEEFELFLSDDSFSNIWDRGLNIQKNSSESTGDVYRSDVWCKIKPWLIFDNGDPEQESYTQFEKIQIRQVIKNAKTLIVVRGDGISFSKYHSSLKEALSRDHDPEKDFLMGGMLEDGVIIFTIDVKKAVDNIVHFLQNISANRNGNADNDLRMQIIVHQISQTKAEDELNLLQELQMVLSGFEFDKLLLKGGSRLTSSSEFQLYITSPVEKLLKKIYSYSIAPLEDRIQHPVTREPAQLYQVLWNNSLVKIQRGDVKTIGRFKIMRELHPNSVFTSFRAMDTYLERLVVLKILRPDFNITTNHETTEELFLNEAKIFGKINHPNIAMIYDIGKEEDSCFFAREYVEGHALSVQKVLNNKINWQRSIRICLNIIDALEFVHEKNIIHGKLEPNNIFLTNGSDIKITDFQIHPFYIPAQSFSKSHIKSLSYFAPEKLDEKPSSLQSDIYSMGVILYELMTDHNPFFASTKNEIIDRVHNVQPEIVSARNSDLPKQLDFIVSKMLAKAPSERYENFSEIKKSLSAVLQNAKE